MLLHNSLLRRAKPFPYWIFFTEIFPKNFRTLRHWASARLIAYPTADVIILEFSVFRCWQHATRSFSPAKRLSSHFITKAGDLHFGDFRKLHFSGTTPIIRWECSTKLRENPLCDCFTDESSKRNEQRSGKFFFQALSSNPALLDGSFRKALRKARSGEKTRRCSRGFIKNSFLWKWKFPFVSNFCAMSETLQDENESFLSQFTLLHASSGWLETCVGANVFAKLRHANRFSLFVAFPSPICVENLVKIAKNPNKPLDVRGWNQLSRASRLFAFSELRKLLFVA